MNATDDEMKDRKKRNAVLITVVLGLSNLAWANTEQQAYDPSVWHTQLQIQKAAEGGDARAQYDLAKQYEGNRLPNFIAKAVELYNRSAEQGYLPAQIRLADIYSRGARGIPINNEMAIKWYTKAADQGDIEMSYHLGHLYQYGSNVKKDITKAIKFYKQAADYGYAPAEHSLGVIYQYGDGGTTEKSKAFDLFERAAKKGYVQSQMSLAQMYQSGDGINQDLILAAKWYEQAAKSGDENASGILGDLYYELVQKYQNSQDESVNSKQLIQWLTMAAEKNNSDAQYTLGVMYDQSQDVIETLRVEKDDELAAKWYRAAAKERYSGEPGNQDAQKKLELMYDSGRAENYDNDSQELAIIRRAAESGHAGMQANLGRRYETGEGVPQNFKIAANWYRKAAEQGYPLAQTKLGVMYGDGSGVQRNWVNAYMLLELAANNGEQAAYKLRSGLSEMMPQEQIEKAKALARNWKVGSPFPQ